MGSRLEHKSSERAQRSGGAAVKRESKGDFLTETSHAAVRRVTYIDTRGSVGQQFAVKDDEGVFRRLGWYVFDHASRANVCLLPELEGVKWARGWQTKAAKVLHIVAAFT